MPGMDDFLTLAIEEAERGRDEGGIPIGAVAGFGGRWVDAGLMRLMDAIIAFPGRLLAIALVASLGGGLFVARYLREPVPEGRSMRSEHSKACTHQFWENS